MSEQEKKVFTAAQVQVLTEKYSQLQLIQGQVNEWLNYLALEYGVTGNAAWKLDNDLSGFVYAPAAPAAPVVESYTEDTADTTDSSAA